MGDGLGGFGTRLGTFGSFAIAARLVVVCGLIASDVEVQLQTERDVAVFLAVLAAWPKLKLILSHHDSAAHYVHIG